MEVNSAYGKMNIVSFVSVSHFVHPLAELEEVGVVLAGVELGRVRLGQERTPGKKKEIKKLGNRGGAQSRVTLPSLMSGGRASGGRRGRQGRRRARRRPAYGKSQLFDVEF